VSPADDLVAAEAGRDTLKQSGSFHQHPRRSIPVTIDISDRHAPSSYEPPRVSWEDYLRWALADEFPSEWVDGEIIKLMTGSVRHQLLMSLLNDLIKNVVVQGSLGLVIFDFLMRLRHRPSGRAPDVMFIATEHMDRLTDTYLDGPADLAVEIVSPDSVVRDRREKLAEYEAAGIREYWIVDDARHEARFYVLDAAGRYQPGPVSADGIYTSTVLPALRLRVDWLWQTPLPTLNAALADLPV
jgi:Uma2 family endonuclease